MMDYLTDAEILLYDLGQRPATFDVVTCIATAIARGAKHVHFVYGNWKYKDYSIAQAEERWRSIVLPAVSLYGLPYTVGKPDEPQRGTRYSHFLNKAVDAYNETGSIGKIPIACEDRGYVTVTLRRSRTPARDSKTDEWRKFAERCDRKVILVPDYDDRKLHLADRMRLYARAHLNMMVINGPLTLCIHSDAPYVSMRTIGCNDGCGSTSPSYMHSIGITEGFQFPWANANQRLSYLDDTLENIEKEYHLMQEQRRAA